MGTSGRPSTLTRGKVVLLLIAALVIGALAGPPLASGAAKAVTTIADPATGKKAHVSSKGRLLTSVCDAKDCAATDRGKLRVGDGSGPLTVDGKVNVGGTVTAYPYPVSKIFSVAIDLNSSSTTTFLREGHTLRLTSITIDNSSGSAADVGIFELSGGTSGCNGNVLYPRYWSGRSEPATTVTAAFPSPIVINGRCAMAAEVLGSTPVHITITGYVVS